MKKQLLLIAGTVLTLASCQNEAANTTDNQAQIDSAVNARVEELRMEMMMQNDSIINAEAQRRADSIVAAMGNATTSKPAQVKTNTKPSAPTKVDKTPNPGSVTTRPGADKGENKAVTDRPGADKGENKTVTERPGADKN